MKIGIRANSVAKQGYGRYGENAYKKLGKHDFSCSDFNMLDRIYKSFKGYKVQWVLFA